MALSLFAIGIASAQSNNFTAQYENARIESTAISDQDRVLSLTIEYTDSTLTVTAHNLIGWDVEVPTQPAQNASWVNVDLVHVNQYIGITRLSNQQLDIIGTPVKLTQTYVFEGVAPGYNHIELDNEVGNEDSKQFITADVDLHDGCSYTIDETWKNTPYLKPNLNRSWTMNIGNAAFDEEWKEFYRLYFGTTAKQINGKTFYPLYLYKYDSHDYSHSNSDNAIIIAWMTDDLRYVARGNELIPSDFWGVGLPMEYVDLSTWPCFQDETDVVLVYPEFTPTTLPDKYSFYNFLTQRFVTAWPVRQEIGYFDGGAYSERSLYYKMIVAGKDADGNETWKGEYVPGIGAVGDWYASNLPFPIYNLSDDIQPTTLMYVRNRIDNDLVVFGSTQGDPTYQGVEKVLADYSTIQWYSDFINLGVISSGKVTLYLYTQDGKLLSVKHGADFVQTATDTLLPGVYIAKAVTDTETATYKFVK